MAALIADRSPQELVAELWTLTGLAWDTVWRGVPADKEERERWCAALGWQPLWFEAGQYVRTRRGGRQYLASVAPGRPVTRVEYTAWGVRAEAVEENAAVTERAAVRWSGYLAAVREVLGECTWCGGWDAPDFPELPGRGPWYSPEWRLEHEAPHRVATWSFSTPGAPLFELTMLLGTGSAASPARADASISLVCHGPADAGDRGPVWLL
ncbi:hypothetical protein [Streptomyces sp. H27-C3]|uniref:hypothetical protein n=1 Tax=Streptomyces sp. H27-C3 TaxID=3046305 RepID=UPI0024BB7161|nr:hypothetical protein [Streptomyces sp. H27-C3]MDJ0464307.1 hypothetical protein [Streptomyces sp. H27-C3]